jgi:hypothetical protein
MALESSKCRGIGYSSRAHRGAQRFYNQRFYKKDDDVTKLVFYKKVGL